METKTLRQWVFRQRFFFFFSYLLPQKNKEHGFFFGVSILICGASYEAGTSSGRMLIQHKKPAWALFFTWEIAQMSFKTAIKVIEQLPSLVVMISGFHSLSKYPWNSHYGLWISRCLTFLEISSLQIKMLDPWGDQKILVSVLRDLFSGVCMGFLPYFLDAEKRASGFATPSSLLFSQYRPDLS